MDKKAFGWDQDLFVGFVYIPPSSSTIVKSGQALFLDTLQSECCLYERKGWILLCGDFNARTGEVQDFVGNDALDNCLPVDDVGYIPDIHLVKRITKDGSPLNANGSALIDFCKGSGY